MHVQAYTLAVSCLHAVLLPPSCVVAVACPESMGLAPWLLKSIRRKGYRLPTPIQRRTIPLILQVRGTAAGSKAPGAACMACTAVAV